MSNDLTNGNIITLDTVGLVSRGPIFIKGLEFYPSAAGDTFTLSHYPNIRKNTIITNTRKQITGTITGTNTLTATGALSSIYAQGALLNLMSGMSTNGSALNRGLFLITTAGNNNAVVSSDSNFAWTNEADKIYDIEAYAAAVAYKILVPATEKRSEGRWFGYPGLRFDNLALTTLSTSAVLYLYI